MAHSDSIPVDEFIAELVDEGLLSASDLNPTPNNERQDPMNSFELGTQLLSEELENHKEALAALFPEEILEVSPDPIYNTCLALALYSARVQKPWVEQEDSLIFEGGSAHIYRAADSRLTMDSIGRRISLPNLAGEEVKKFSFTSITSNTSDLKSDLIRYFGHVAQLLEAREKTWATVSELKSQTGHQGSLDAICVKVLATGYAEAANLQKFFPAAEAGKKVPLPALLAYVNERKDDLALRIDEFSFAKIRSVGIHSSFMGHSFAVSYTMYIPSTGGFMEYNSQSYAAIEEEMSIRDVKIVPIAETDEAKTRNQELPRLRDNLRYCQVELETGYFWHRRVRYTVPFRGRCMVDANSFFEEFGADQNVYDVYTYDDKETKAEQMNEEQMRFTTPLLPVYSMQLKRWLWADVRSLGQVTFNKEAVDKLVLESRLRDRLTKYVTAPQMRSVDLIQGKGGGRVVLSFGGPGTGKTVTAEALAEVLERPLYSVTVGELGTTREELEENLNKVMRICERWNAVALIDEVDIFVHKRDGTDIERDAMTGVFLRTIEYYQGIMFMTTNLVDQLDSAFLSRIGMVIDYGKEPRMEDRYSVWVNLLSGLGLSYPQSEVMALAEMKLNNRDIKNILNNARIQYGENHQFTFNELVEEVRDYTKYRHRA